MPGATIRASGSRLGRAWPRQLGRGRRYASVCQGEVIIPESTPFTFRRWMDRFLPGASALLAYRNKEAVRKGMAIREYATTIEQLRRDFLATVRALYGLSLAEPDVGEKGHSHPGAAHWPSPVVNVPLPRMGKRSPLPPEIDIIDDEVRGGSMPPRPTRTVTMRFERIGRKPPRVSEALED